MEIWLLLQEKIIFLNLETYKDHPKFKEEYYRTKVLAGYKRFIKV